MTSVRVRDINQLSDSELKALDLVSLGYRDRELALKMGVSYATVRGIKSSIVDKLYAKNIAHAIRIAFENGILQIKREE